MRYSRSRFRIRSENGGCRWQTANNRRQGIGSASGASKFMAWADATKLVKL